MLWQPTTEGPGDPAWDGVLPADAVYMIWLNAASAKKYAQNGSDVVYTTPFYVAGDGSNGWLSVCVIHHPAKCPASDSSRQSIRCIFKHTIMLASSTYINWHYLLVRVGGGGGCRYNAEIMPEGLSPQQQQHVLGAEICMWGESGSAGNLAVRAFQIGAAAAENFWKNHTKAVGPGAANGLGISDRYNRFLCHLKRFGIDAAPVMPSSCEVVA